MDNAFLKGFAEIFNTRKREADEYYAAILPKGMSDDMAKVQRQALAGLLWSKQYYHFDVETWLTTSDGISPVSDGKKYGRNSDWKHLKNQDIISMPDKWEYPWYAAWDLAFQCISMAVADPTFAKHPVVTDYAGMVYEARRPIACIRMELQRCEPACTCMVSHAGVLY